MQTRSFHFADTIYHITDDGRVFNSNNVELKQSKDGDTRRVTLKTSALNMKVAVHRLMGICFLFASNFHDVKHTDKDASNNVLSNLSVTLRGHEVSKAGNSIAVIDGARPNLGLGDDCGTNLGDILSDILARRAAEAEQNRVTTVLITDNDINSAIAGTDQDEVAAFGQSLRNSMTASKSIERSGSLSEAEYNAEPVTVSNGVAQFKTTRGEVATNKWYKKHNFKIIKNSQAA